MIEITVEDVPTLHKGRVFCQKSVLHILEIVFSHLEVHLVLEHFELLVDFVVFVKSIKLLDKELASLLPALSIS